MATDEQRIAALEARIDELQSQIARLSRRDSMHQTLTCPACGCGQLLAVKQVNESTGPSSTPLSLGSFKHWFDGVEGDPFYVYVCTHCRLVEWHVYSLAHLEPDGELVRAVVRPPVDPGAGDAPYR